MELLPKPADEPPEYSEEDLKAFGNKVVYNLEVENELRVEVSDVDEGEKGGIVLELVDGMAEIFGSEITSKNQYNFPPGSTFAVFTWHGCKVAIHGKTDVAYISDDSPMGLYFNTHVILDNMRELAKNQNTRGPRVMVVGGTDVGKSTLCNMFTNWATRLGRAPTLVDLDLGQGQICIPGTIGACIVDRQADVLTGFNTDASICYHVGHTSPAENMDLYRLVIQELAQDCNFRAEMVESANSSGTIINTCGWIKKGGGYESLITVAGAFEVDMIIVLDNDRLFQQLESDMPDFVKIMNYEKSGGVVERSMDKRADLRHKKIKDFFYGPDHSLCPAPFDVAFTDLQLYKIGGPILPESMLPLGEAPKGTTKPFPVAPSVSLKHRVVSLSSVMSDEEDFTTENVLGFFVITAVDMVKEVYSVLCQAPGPLPRPIGLVMEDINFMEMK